jgi:hypothetical protein
MYQQKFRIGWKMAAVIITCFMMAAGQSKKTTAINKWFCLATDPVGIIVDYKKNKTRKSTFNDTCSSVWFHDVYGYKLYLKNGDSVQICTKCLTWGRFLEFENSKKSGKSSKNVQKISNNKDVKSSDNKKEKHRKKK